MIPKFELGDNEIEYKNYLKILLINSDWTQLPDSPADKQAWAIYRQALRDLNNHPDWPNVELPDTP
jgi:hypothetical protein